MTLRKARVVGVWLALLVLAAAIAAHARYITDLSAFLPARPTPMQRLLIDQLRAGPASRLILVSLEGGSLSTRAAISIAMAQRLRADREFASINNGEAVTADRDRAFVFGHRYALSEAVTAERFSAAGLKDAIETTLAGLASPEGVFLKSLVPHDPTGETLQVIDQLSRTAAPQSREGVWSSADGERSLLVAQTAAAGSDTDAQERAQSAIQAAFAGAAHAGAAHAGAAVRLRMSGPGVFAVSSRATIKRAAVRLSIASSALVVVILLAVYRSIPALLLGLLPVATGALIGVAAVALGFGAVHGITLGFGITLIGESVDYSIYFFIQSLRRSGEGAAAESWRTRLWPTMRLGMLTSVIGFASLLPSGFPGLSQLGAYSISGLLAAAAVTRFVLPELLPRGFTIRDLSPMGARIGRVLGPARRLSAPLKWGAAAGIAAAALEVMVAARGTLWNRELASLSPISQEAQRYDATLRGDLGAPNVLDLVVVTGETLDSVLSEAERAGDALEPLIQRHIIGGFDSPASYVPSLGTQSARRAGLPDTSTLRANLAQATDGLALDATQLSPFLEDVESARHAAPIAPRDLQGTSLAAGFDALIFHQADHWNALMPLHAANSAAPDIDTAQLRGALAALGSNGARLLDMKQESDALYDDYLHEVMRLSLAGFAVIAALLWIALHSLRRTARVLAPLVLSVLSTAAALALFHVQLTILQPGRDAADRRGRLELRAVLRSSYGSGRHRTAHARLFGRRESLHGDRIRSAILFGRAGARGVGHDRCAGHPARAVIRRRAHSATSAAPPMVADRWIAFCAPRARASRRRSA